MSLSTRNSLLINRICSVRIAPLSKVVSFATADGHTRQAIATWQKHYSHPASATFSEVEEKTPAGSLYIQSLTLSYPGKEPHNSKQLWAIDQLEHLIEFSDQYGRKYMMGSPELGAVPTWKYDTETQGHTITFILSDTYPLGISASVDQFFIDAQGFLVAEITLPDEFSVNDDGHLLVEGPNENNYVVEDENLYYQTD
jgi:hypothetical protein